MVDDILNFFYKNRILIIVIIVFLIVIAILSLVLNRNGEEENTPNNSLDTTTLTLFGSLNVELEEGSEYIEPGYYAADSKGIIKTDLVIVSGNVDTSTVGTYTITYTIDGVKKTRTVNVIEKEEVETESENEVITFELLGEDALTISLNSGYTEPGYTATSSIAGDLKDYVSVSGTIDTSSSGVYTLTYRLTYKDKVYEKIRTVVVSNDNLSIAIIKLTIKVTGDNFSYIKLPDNVLVQTKETTYTVSDNGDYTFIAYSKTGKSYERTIKIDTIDKTAPTGTCNATINNTSTTIKVTAVDAFSKIKSYTYYDNGKIIATSTDKSYVVNRKTSNVITVKVIDNATNERILVCTVK